MTQFVAFRDKTLVMTPASANRQAFQDCSPASQKAALGGGPGRTRRGGEAGVLLVTSSQATCWTQAPAPAGPAEPGGEKTSDLIEVLQKYGLNEPISASSSPHQPQESQKRNEAAQDLGPTALSQQGTVPSLTACLGNRAVGSLAPSSS